jgi:sialate O-acetylesterase
VGDVWLCGGQLNLGLPLRFTRNGEEEAKAANYPDIRFFSVAGHVAYHHTEVVEGKWSAVTPQTADWISAVAYNFARRVQQDVHVPIGLLLDNMGGTPAEAWTSAEALRPLDDFDVPLAELARLAEISEAIDCRAIREQSYGCLARKVGGPLHHASIADSVNRIRAGGQTR